MSRKPKILIVGSFVMDMIVSTEKFPNSGETVLGKTFRTAPGGKGANQAVQAARLGADVTMVGKVGADEFGKSLIQSCVDAGIHTEHILTDPNVSSAIGNVMLEIGREKTVKNRIIVVPGANMTITPQDVAFLEGSIRQYDMVVLQLEIPMKVNELVAQYAFEQQVPILLNSAPSAPLSPTLLSHLTYLSPNEHEAADLTGIPIRKAGKEVNQQDLKAVADALLSKGVRNAVITLGSAGAALVNADKLIYRPCIDTVTVKDPTAAGDSFIGAFTTAVCSGMDDDHALCFANYTAALTVSREGAQPSLPCRDEVIRLMRQNNETDCIL